jgi:hypothetical protein
LQLKTGTTSAGEAGDHFENASAVAGLPLQRLLRLVEQSARFSIAITRQVGEGSMSSSTCLCMNGRASAPIADRADRPPSLGNIGTGKNARSRCRGDDFVADVRIGSRPTSGIHMSRSRNDRRGTSRLARRHREAFSAPRSIAAHQPDRAAT